MTDAESELLRDLSRELDSMSDIEDDISCCLKPRDFAGCPAHQSMFLGKTQTHCGIPRTAPGQAQLRSSVSAQRSASCELLSPAHGCAGPLSPNSTATVAPTSLTLSRASSYFQPPAAPHTTTSCTSTDIDRAHQINGDTANTSAECPAPNSPQDISARTPATAEPAPAPHEQRRCLTPEHRIGEASSEGRAAQKKRPRVRNRGTAVFASHTHAPARSTAPLANLPHDILQNILQHASAADLTRAACTCKALRRAGGSESLWRRLYYARWGAFRGGEEKIMGASFWKRTYMARDAADHESQASCQAEALRGDYHSLLLTEREATVPAGAEPSWNLLMGSTQEQVAAFVRARGFSATVQRPADLRSVQLVRFGDVFVDDKSGWLHVCDKGCDLQAPEDSGAFMVCPLTGRMHGRVAVAWDGGACSRLEEMGDNNDAGVAAAEARDVEGEGPVGGWMAKVYEAGYCHNEEDDGCLRKCALLALELTK